MEAQQHFLLPSSVANAIAASSAPWGAFGVRRVPADGLYVIAEYTIKQRVRRPAMSRWLDEHCSRGASITSGVGFWYRAEPELNLSWDPVWRRRVSVPTEWFRDRINGWQQPGNATIPVLTHTEDDQAAPWRGWLVSKEIATPITLELVSETANIYADYPGAWPLERLRSALVTIVGVGSIGSASAQALTEYGVRRLALVDYDRLQFHNLARHKLLARDIGR